MDLGFFTMPIHPVAKDWRTSLHEDCAAFLLADELGFTEGYVGEHTTDAAENITHCISFIAWIASQTKDIRLGTGTVNLPNTHPAAVAGQIAMLDHMLDGRLIFGISPGGLATDAEVWVAAARRIRLRHGGEGGGEGPRGRTLQRGGRGARAAARPAGAAATAAYGVPFAAHGGASHGDARRGRG